MGARKASWSDVRRIALSLPESSERERGGHASWSVRDKTFVWERPLRPSDLAALGARAPKGPIVAFRVEHLLVKEALIESDPRVYFTTPHFDGYPAVLVRLDRISIADLKDRIVEAWHARAPKRLVQQLTDRAPRSGGGSRRSGSP